MNPDDARRLLSRLLDDIAPDADLATIGDAEPLQEALDLDSMDFLNLMAALQEATGIDLPERDYPALSTVRGFTAYVAQHAPGP